MEDNTGRLSELFVDSLLGVITEEDEKILNDWIIAHPEQREILRSRSFLKSEIENFGCSEQEIKEQFLLVLNKLNKVNRKDKAIIRSFRFRWVKYAAAVFILIFGLLIFLYLNRTPNKIFKSKVNKLSHIDIAPGGSKAILTLSDGTDIILDQSQNGQLTKQGNAVVFKSDSLLTYQQQNDAPVSSVLYNTMRTPRAGVYTLVLSDGSKVTLNSVSTIRYPIAFIGETREVEVSGEAYFEVAKDIQHPFIVKILSAPGGKIESRVQVLGTEFNIMAYPEEGSIKTTLLNGAVRMRTDNNEVQLKPGQLGELNRSGNKDKISVKEANTDFETAWKRGFFKFEGTDLKEVMLQLSRWYDVEVKYEDNLSPFEINGTIPRNVNISEVLKVFEFTGAHFKIDNKTITVTH